MKWVAAERVVLGSLLLVSAAAALALTEVHWLYFIDRLEASVASADAIEVRGAAGDGVWHFEYPDGQVATGLLYVPIGRTIKLRLTSISAATAFYAPDLGIHRLAFPGSFTELSFRAPRGRFPVRCGGPCFGATGTEGRMRAPGAAVVAIDDEEFAKRLSGLGTGAAGSAAPSNAVGRP